MNAALPRPTRRGSLALLAGALLLGAQAAGAVESWARHYSADVTLIPYAVAATRDGAFVCLATIPGDGRDVAVFKTDPMGVVQWSRRLTAPDQQYLYDLVETVSGDLVALGDSWFSGTYDAWLVRLTSDGDLEWEETLSSTGVGRGNELVPTSDDGIILVGGISFVPSETSAHLIAKVDAAGAVEWTLACQTEVGAYFRDVAASPAGRYLATGDLDTRLAWSLQLDAAGSIDGKTGYGNATEWLNLWAVAPREGGGWCVGARLGQQNGVLDDLVVLALDTSGGITWQRRLVAPGDDDVSDILGTPDGGCLAVGKTDSFLGEDHGWIVVFDGSGALVSQRLVEEASEVFALAQPAAGGVVAAALDLRTLPARTILLRLDESWELGPSCATLSPTNATVQPADLAVLPAVTTDTARPLPREPVGASTPVGGIYTSCGGCRELSGDLPLLDLPCDGSPSTLTAILLGGEPPIAVSWDLDGDTIEDATGEVVEQSLPAGTWSATVRATDSCASGSQSWSQDFPLEVPSPVRPLGEVSNVRGGERPLHVTTTELTAEHDPDAVAYHAYVDLIGSWYAPSVATGTSCFVPWTERGDGSVLLELLIPVNSWLDVSAAHSCSEGPLGSNSFGEPRTDSGTWSRCGPSP